LAVAAATWVRSATSCVGEAEGSSLKVRNESRNLCHLNSVTGGSNGIVDKGKLSHDLGILVCKTSAVVVIATVVLHFCNGVPVVKVSNCLL